MLCQEAEATANVLAALCGDNAQKRVQVQACLLLGLRSSLLLGARSLTEIGVLSHKPFLQRTYQSSAELPARGLWAGGGHASSEAL